MQMQCFLLRTCRFSTLLAAPSAIWTRLRQPWMPWQHSLMCHTRSACISILYTPLTGSIVTNAGMGYVNANRQHADHPCRVLQTACCVYAYLQSTSSLQSLARMVSMLPVSTDIPHCMHVTHSHCKCTRWTCSHSIHATPMCSFALVCTG